MYRTNLGDGVQDCVGNLDIAIATEGPRIAPSRPAMRERLAELLGIPTNNVKGKTLEGMGALAKGAGITLIINGFCVATT